MAGEKGYSGPEPWIVLTFITRSRIVASIQRAHDVQAAKMAPAVLSVTVFEVAPGRSATALQRATRYEQLSLAIRSRVSARTAAGRRCVGARDQDIEELDRKLLVQFRSVRQHVQPLRPIVKPPLGVRHQPGCDLSVALRAFGGAFLNVPQLSLRRFLCRTFQSRHAGLDVLYFRDAHRDRLPRFGQDQTGTFWPRSEDRTAASIIVITWIASSGVTGLGPPAVNALAIAR